MDCIGVRDDQRLPTVEPKWSGFSVPSCLLGPAVSANEHAAPSSVRSDRRGTGCRPQYLPRVAFSDNCGTWGRMECQDSSESSLSNTVHRVLRGPAAPDEPSLACLMDPPQ